MKTQDDKMIIRHSRDGDCTVSRFSKFLHLCGRTSIHPVTRNLETTINAVYAIDPKSNGGKTYQYDEVVRNKDQRQRMHGGDCECCREVNSVLLFFFWRTRLLTI